MIGYPLPDRAVESAGRLGILGAVVVVGAICASVGAMLVAAVVLRWRRQLRSLATAALWIMAWAWLLLCGLVMMQR